MSAGFALYNHRCTMLAATLALPLLCVGLPTPHSTRPKVSNKMLAATLALPLLCVGLPTPHSTRPKVSNKMLAATLALPSWLAAILLVFVAGCGAPEKTAEPIEVDAAPDAGAGVSMSAGNLELRYYKTGTAGEASSKPVFLLRAEHFDVDEARTRYEIVGVHIEIAEDAGREAIVMDGARGTYEVKHVARLEGGVVVTVGDTRIEAEELTYELPDEETAGVMYTEHPVTIESPAMNLRAEALRILPETKQMIIKNPVGTIRLEGMGR